MPQYGIHDYQNREFSLTNPPVQMAAYTPLEFKPQGINPEFLANRLDKMDAADAENQKQKTAIDLAYAKQREQVHADPESLRLFDEQVNAYNEKVKQAVDASSGSYHRLGAMMQNLAADSQSNKLLNALTKANTEYQNWVKTDIDSRNDIDDLSKEYYRDLAERTYTNSFVNDKDGNVIGSDWKPNVQVYSDLQSEDLAKIALAFTAYQQKAGGGNNSDIYALDQTGKATKIGFDKNKKLQGYDALVGAKSGATIGANTSSKWDWTRLTSKQLDETLDAYIRSNSQLRERIRDDFNKQKYKRDKAYKALQDPSNLSQDTIAQYQEVLKEFDTYYQPGAAGGSTSYIKVYADKIKDILKNSAYNRTQYVSGSGLDFSHFGSSGGEKTTDTLLSNRDVGNGKGPLTLLRPKVDGSIYTDGVEDILDE